MKVRRLSSLTLFQCLLVLSVLICHLIIIIHAEGSTSTSNDNKQQNFVNTSTTIKPNNELLNSTNNNETHSTLAPNISFQQQLEHYEPRELSKFSGPIGPPSRRIPKYYRATQVHSHVALRNRPNVRLRPYYVPPPNYHYHTPYEPQPPYYHAHSHSYPHYPPPYYYDDHVHYFSHRFRPPTEIQLFEPPVITIRSGVDPKGKLVSSLVNRASQAVQNLIEHTRNRSRPRLVKFMSERRRSSGGGGRLFPSIRERLSNRLDRIESRSSTSPSLSSSGTIPTNNNSNINNNDGDKIEYSESRVHHNETDYRNNHHKPDHNKTTMMSKSIDYEQEGKKLRQDIVDKVGHLQTILTTAFEVSKERRDIILSRLLRNTNNRLERAKLRADQILSEPSTSELAVKTLHHINNGMNNMNSFLQSLMNRINISINVQMKNPNNNQNNSDNNNNGTTSHPDEQIGQEKIIDERLK